MSSLLKRLLAVTSALAMLCSFSAVSVSANETSTKSDVLLNYYNKPLMEDGIHGDTNLEDMEYVHYEISDIQDTFDGITNLSTAEYNNQNVETFFDLSDQLDVFSIKVVNSYNLASLYYNQDPTTTNLYEYTSTSSLYTEFVNEYDTAFQTLMKSSFGENLLNDLYELANSDSQYADNYYQMYVYFSSFLYDDTLNDEAKAINTEISNKISKYFSLVQTDISNKKVSYKGKKVLYSDLMSQYVTLFYQLVFNYSSYDSIPQSKLDEYYAIEDAINSAKKSYGIDDETLGKLYIDLLKLYNNLAVAQGYSSYIDMSYDYDLEEINEISSDVKEYITPIVEDYSAQLSQVPNYSSAFSDVYSIDKAKELSSTVISAVGDEYLDIYDYMIDHNLLVIDDDYTYSQGYTTLLPEYSQGYIYMTFSSNFYSWFTNGISHEFGHFIDWYANLDGFIQTQNSVSENVSVSFSYLCNENLNAYFDDLEKSNILCVSNTLDNTLNYVNGCLSVSDLELYAFQNADTVTPSELQEQYLQLMYDYGLLGDVAYNLGGLKEYSSYVDINQIYTQPFYNTDYAMAGLTALNVLNVYAKDKTSGIELFDSLYTNDYYYDDYVTMMSEGLGIDVYADDYVSNIAQNLDSYLKSKMASINGTNLGDVNLDGSIDATDLLTLKKYLLGMDVSNLDFYTSSADLNNDGTVNILDLLTLKKMLLRID